MYHRKTAAINSIRLAFLCLLWTCVCVCRAAGEPLPYPARVIVAGAPVYSGPGDKFYPTDTLSQGDTVEVYREKPGGWLAIRPPLNSYSWVAERDLIIKDGGLGEVVKDDVASRIGSRLNEQHNAAQIRLKKGEGVEVLGEQNIGGEKWYKIAPPAGEFRWIQASTVERSGPIQGPSSEQTKPAADDAGTIQQMSGAAATPAPVANTTNESVAPPLMPVTKPAGASNRQTSNTPPVAPTAAPLTPAALPAPAATPQTQPTQASGDLSQELAGVELRLSRMVAAPTNLWNTERLERDTAQLLARARTAAERDAVRVTQEKINRFAEIGRRANPSSSNVAQASQAPPGAGSGDPRTTFATTTAGGQYDAVGVLRPVVSRRPGAPQFALVDERGQVISFVSATPDLNLQPYLGRRVGVVGNRGYIPEFQRSNVTAARVTPLNDRLVR